MVLAIQAAPHTVDPAYACTSGPIGNFARAVWDMWLPREWLTKLAYAAVGGREEISGAWEEIGGAREEIGGAQEGNRFGS